MDARQHINQLRRKKPQGRRRQNWTATPIRDLRQLIGAPENKPTKQRSGGVKNRIGYVTKSRMEQMKTLNQSNKVQKAKSRMTHRVSVANEMPKVTINVGQRNRVQRQFAASNTNVRMSKQKTNESSFFPIISGSSGQSLLPLISGTPVIIMQQNPVEAFGSKLAMDSVPPPVKLDSRTPVSKISNTSVLVTNLNKNISLADVEELFGEIGALVDAKMINPTMALITYQNYNDAVHACQTYHNRLLDGFPMQCNILPDTATHQPKNFPRTSSSTTLSQRFRAQSAFDTPTRSDVKFTVKL